MKLAKLYKKIKTFRHSAESRAIGIGFTLLFLAILLSLTFVFYQHHKNSFDEIRRDPLALAYVLSAWALSILLLNGVRAVLDVQYLKYLKGRIDQLLYLEDWGLLFPVFIALPSLAWSYYSEPWSIGANSGSILAILSISWAMYQFIRDVSGVWLARSDDVFFYPNEDLLDQNQYHSAEAINKHFRNESSPLWAAQVNGKRSTNPSRSGWNFAR